MNPKLYEINTRIWIKQFGENAKLRDIPFDYFKSLSHQGINIVWLLGIWKTCYNQVDQYCFTQELISEYSKALPDWKKEDVIGSPFSIDEYSVNPKLGSEEDVIILKEKLNSAGIKLFLDFVPNHFGSGTKYIREAPEYFLAGDDELFVRDRFTFFKSPFDESKIFAHGRDPFFPAWEDTAQLNYFNEDTRSFMINNLIKISKLCDGVRCDMAMLELNNVFENTWLGVLNKQRYAKPDSEFWSTAISAVKKLNPDFIFLAEAYWDLEWQLQQLGFDFTYDKKLTDRLVAKTVSDIKAHLNADKEYQEKSMRFLENHDELRAVEKFGIKESLAAAVLVTTIEGMRLYFDGQFSGKHIKVPIQLGREPEEKTNVLVKQYYDKILNVTKENIFNEGDWQILNAMPVSENNFSFENILAWQWKLGDEVRIIVINYADCTSQCRLKFCVASSRSEILLIDLLNEVKYLRAIDEINTVGLFVELKSYQSHIFKVSDAA